MSDTSSNGRRVPISTKFLLPYSHVDCLATVESWETTPSGPGPRRWWPLPVELRKVLKTMIVTVLVGNPRPKSRTLIVASTVADSICRLGGYTRGSTIDLALFGGRLFDWSDDEVDELTTVVASSGVLVCASPTYKAAYTGLLKLFLDRYDTAGLQSVTAIPVMTGGSSHHALAPDTALRPLLVELGACVPTTSLYFEMTRFQQMDAVVEAWTTRNQRVLRLIQDGTQG